MSRWDIAEWRGPTPNQGGRMLEQRGLVVHIAEGSYEGTIAWQKNPTASVSSHFVVRADGHIAQCVDSDVVAWTQRDGNGRWLSVENEGHTPRALTDAQVEANARLLAYGHKLYGYPLTLAGSPSGRGLGYHSMGAEHGVNWGHSDCPGPAIKAQLPAILERAIQIAGGSPEGDDMTKEEHDLLVAMAWRVDALKGGYDTVQGGPYKGEPMWVNQALKAIDRKLSAIGTGDPDTAAIIAAISKEMADLEVEVRDAVADLGEGGAAQVRADA